MAPDSGISHDNLGNKAPSRKDIVIEEALSQVDRNSAVLIEVIGESLAAVRTNPKFPLTSEAVLDRVRARVAEEAAAQFEQRENENPMNLIKQAFLNAADPSKEDEVKIAQINTSAIGGWISDWRSKLRRVVQKSRNSGQEISISDAYWHHKFDTLVEGSKEYKKIFPTFEDFRANATIEDEVTLNVSSKNYDFNPPRSYESWTTRVVQNLGVDIEELNDLTLYPSKSESKGGPHCFELVDGVKIATTPTNIEGVSLWAEFNNGVFDTAWFGLNMDAVSRAIEFDQL